VDPLELAIQIHRHAHGPSIDYAGVGLAATAGWVGVPGLGEAALIAAGILAARGHLDIGEVVVVAWIGATIGGVAGWLVGLKVGHTVFGGPGPLRPTRLRVLAAGERFYSRYGALAVFFTPSWLAGITRMKSGLYLALNAVSAVIWALLVGLGAYWIGPSIEDVLSDVGLAGVVLVAAIAAVGGALTLTRGRRRGTWPRARRPRRRRPPPDRP
jgi:membrane protein DedA with SNARE-associated domain